MAGPQVVVTSFGYGHSAAPEADLTVDARRNLRNPHHDPAMRDLTGLDQVVRDHVLATPGARGLINHTVAGAYDLAIDTGQPVAVATGCVGGRHRAPALAEEIAAGLHAMGVHVTVTHRDVTKPIIQVVREEENDVKITQKATKVNNIAGPVTITGTTVTQSGKVIAQVGIDQTADDKKTNK